MMPFAIPGPRLAPSLTVACAITLCSLAYATASANVYPQNDAAFRQSLDGQWSFKYIPSLDPGADAKFYEPSFDVAPWKHIKVPGNWEMQGFAEPFYGNDLKDGLGLYRRTFRAPAGWIAGGRRVFLRFEGVAYGFEAWVNGTKVGASSASAYNPDTFDITDALKPDADNMLAVQVSTKPHGFEFDVNDDWSLGGICRDVTLFSVPATHVQDVTTRTKLAGDGAAELSVSVAVSAPDGEMRGKLLAPDGKVVGEFDLPRQADGCHEAVVKVAKPQLWTAETPSLYKLQVELSENGKPLQTIEEKIGLRKISIKDGVLLLNGRPIKLRGVDHHDMDPLDGRAITEEEMRRDLELMKKGNINFLRTSHYPPQPRLIELCDEMGIYVMCEVAIGRGEEHLDDPAYRENILARVEPTITRDKNRPSVIVWSIGNENPINDAEMEAGRRAKELDPTRPICIPKIGSYFRENVDRIPEHVDIYAPHYPVIATLREYAQKLKRPVILTEYAHALGLATDRIQDEWEFLQTTPTFAGGAIWMFQDQGILRKSETPVDRTKPTQVVWLDANRYYDSFGLFGADGLVYSDRTPQTDYWQTRKVYSPVQIAERSATVKSGTQEIALTVENRHDFRSLEGIKLDWSLQRNGTEIQKGEAPLHASSHEKETARLPINIPSDAAGDVLALDVRAIDENGLQITERTVRLDLADSRRGSWFDDVETTGSTKITESKTEIKVESPQWVMTVARATGELTIRDREGRVLVEGIYPHPGRKLTMAEHLAIKKARTWQPSTLTKLDSPEVSVTKDGSNIHLSVSGTYVRPKPTDAEKQPEKKTDDPLLVQTPQPDQSKPPEDQSFVGGYRAEIAPNGVITISYDYVPTNAMGNFTEAGLSVVLAPGLTEFRWMGQGPYPGYPGKDRLNEFGIYHLNREDLRFQGNRRETEVAMMTTPAGAGVALAPATAADVSVERDGDRTLLSHNAVISGLGNKGPAPETNVDSAQTPHVAGSFSLVPLGDNAWPKALTRWFGKPAAAKDVFKPFYHSYDQ